MTIKNLLMQNVAAGADSKNLIPEAAQKVEKTESFDKYMRDAERAEKPQQTKQSRQDKSVKRDTSRPQAEKPENAGTVNEAEKQAPKAEKTGATEKPEATKPADKPLNLEDEAAALEQEIIAKLAAELGISADKLAEMLNALDIKAYELVEPEKMNTLVQELTGAKDAAEMLTMPEVKETLVKLNTALTEFEAVAKEIAVKIEAAADNTTDTKPVVENTQARSLVAEQKPEQAFNPANTQENAEPKAEQRTGETRQDSRQETGAKHSGEGTGGRHELPKVENTVTPRTADFNVMANAPQPVQNTARTEAVAQAAKSVNTQDIIDQIVSKIKVEVRTDVTQVKMTLKPESLGEVQMKIISQNGIVTAQFIAESQRVKEAIEAGFTDLKDMLSQQGVDIGQLSVSVGSGEADTEAERFLNEGRNRFSQIRQAELDDAEQPAPERTERDALYQGSVSIRA